MTIRNSFGFLVEEDDRRVYNFYNRKEVRNLNTFNLWEVVWAILDNKDRISKLKSLKDDFKLYDKINGYIIAVSRELKIKLTEEERRECRYQILKRIKE